MVLSITPLQKLATKIEARIEKWKKKGYTDEPCAECWIKIYVIHELTNLLSEIQEMEPPAEAGRSRKNDWEQFETCDDPYSPFYGQKRKIEGASE